MRLLLLTLLLVVGPAVVLAQGDDHDHAAESEDHSAEPAATTSPGGRPGWAWPVAVILLAGAAVVPAVARGSGAQRLTGAVTAGLCIAAVAVLAVTRPRLEAPAAEAHAEHADEGDELLTVSDEAAAELGIATETVMPGELATSLRATGRIVAVESRQAHLGPRIAGRLTAVRVRLGDRVEAGEVVATLDSVDAAQAAAALREAQARLDAARAGLSARREFTARGSYTAEPLEAARRELADARVSHAQAATELAQARNERDGAAAELARTERLIAAGSFTEAQVEDARGRLAEAEQALAGARQTLAEAEADQAAAAGEVSIAAERLAGARELAERTSRLAATGDLDRGPLEAAQDRLAEARTRRQQAAAALDQAQRQARRGEELHRDELISLNELETRRRAVRESEAAADEATSAEANAAAALARAERIAGEAMTSGRAEQEARAAEAEAQRELAAAEARAVKAVARVSTAQAGRAPAEEAVAAARANLARELSVAGDRTHADSALDAARLRLAQADRLVSGKDGEVREAAARVATAASAARREEGLAASRVRAREALATAESEVRTAAIAREHAAEVLHLLGAVPAGRTVSVPIRTPIAGLVTHLDASVGEAVSAERELLTVVDLTEVYVEADVDEVDLPRLAEGQAVRVTVRGRPDQPFLGTVTSLGGELDPETRAAHVRALVPNPDWLLRAEMFADVGFVTDRAGGLLTVAAEAIQEVDGRPVVFVRREPERYEPREVVPGRSADGRIAVTSGLTAGERVVTTGSYLLKSQLLKDELGEGHSH